MVSIRVYLPVALTKRITYVSPFNLTDRRYSRAGRIPTSITFYAGGEYTEFPFNIRPVVKNSNITIVPSETLSE